MMKLLLMVKVKFICKFVSIFFFFFLHNNLQNIKILIFVINRYESSNGDKILAWRDVNKQTKKNFIIKN